MGGSGVAASIQMPSRRERRLHGAWPALVQRAANAADARQNVSQS